MTRREFVSRALPMLAVIAVLGGCTGHAPTRQAETGTLTGRFTITGGPIGNVDHPQEGTIWIWAGHIDKTHALAARPELHVVTDSDGRFSILLKPGDYSVLGSPGTSKVIEASMCPSAVPVTVHAGSAVSAEVDCDVL